MNWAVWAEIEAILVNYGVIPILAVVPDNRCSLLKVGPPLPEFWQRVRDWQRKGWTIALHGYHHEYVTQNPGILKLDAKSEFAGIAPHRQKELIAQAANIFSREGVQPLAWVAPGHSFDLGTIRALRHVGIQIISDGYAIFPFHSHGMLWIPQQLWRFYSLPAGVWTICFHHNSWTKENLGNFATAIEHFRHQIVSLPSIVEEFWGRPPDLADRLMTALFPWLIKAKRLYTRWPLCGNIIR